MLSKIIEEAYINHIQEAVHPNDPLLDKRQANSNTLVSEMRNKLAGMLKNIRSKRDAYNNPDLSIYNKNFANLHDNVARLMSAAGSKIWNGDAFFNRKEIEVKPEYQFLNNNNLMSSDGKTTTNGLDKYSANYIDSTTKTINNTKNNFMQQPRLVKSHEVHSADYQQSIKNQDMYYRPTYKSFLS